MDYYPPLPFYKTETLNPNSYCYNYPVTDNFNPNFGQSFESLNTFTRPFNDNQGDANRGYYEPQTFVVRPADIGRDPRTTIMIRNIPNKYTIRELAEEIDEELNNTYDFLYLPCDIKNQCNVGYGFINFLTTQYL